MCVGGVCVGGVCVGVCVWCVCLVCVGVRQEIRDKGMDSRILYSIFLLEFQTPTFAVCVFSLLPPGAAHVQAETPHGGVNAAKGDVIGRCRAVTWSDYVHTTPRIFAMRLSQPLCMIYATLNMTRQNATEPGSSTFS